MKVVVLGAGVLGVSSAWYLARAGHEVTVLERNSGAARETSFGNGGQISVSHAEPWANPGAPLKLLKWLGREDAPLLLRLRADPAQWAWGLKFLMECRPSRVRWNMRQLVNLGLYSRGCLQRLRAELQLDYDHLERGILHFYTDAGEFERCVRAARFMTELGCDRQVLSPDEALAIEPALAHIRPALAGATYTAADESGDVHKFTVALAAAAARQGVHLRYGVRVQRLNVAAGTCTGVEYVNEGGAYETAQADACVLAMGSFSRALARQVGLKLDIYPVKGYSVTLPVQEQACAPSVSLTDDGFKLVYSRLGNRLRIAGTAEIGDYGMALNRVRCEAIVRRVLEVFPGAGNAGQVGYWCGLRPSTPSNVPYIGKSAVRGLYLNTGHGTLGWTHGCGSGRAIADIVSGRKPEVDFAFTGI